MGFWIWDNLPHTMTSSDESSIESILLCPSVRAGHWRVSAAGKNLLMRTRLSAFVPALSLLLAHTVFGANQGDAAPDFALPVLGSESTGSLSATHGKVRYIDFWASWCAPCRVSIPEIVALQEEYGGDSFEVIGISVDERVEDALDFMDRFPMNYVNLSDPDGKIAEAYALGTMPTSFVIDPEGRITLVHEGFRRGDMETIREHIAELLSRPGTEGP